MHSFSEKDVGEPPVTWHSFLQSLESAKTTANMSSHERTPLVQTVNARPRERHSQDSVCGRFCKIACLSTLVAVIVCALIPGVLLPQPDGHRHHHHPPSQGHGPVAATASNVSYAELQDILLNTPTGDKAAEWSRYYTAGPHLAGKNYSQAEWTKEKWEEFGVASTIVAYETYINYPLGHRLALYEKSSSKKAENGGVIDLAKDWKVKFEASLEEDVLEEDPTSGLVNRVPTFHGYSASGNVTGRYVYVNYGTYQDFEDLIKANVSLKGNIAIARYGGIFRGLKVKRAQDLGMIGTVIYSDPGDDGSITDENGIDTYPKGPARNPSAVQRGSTQFLSVAPGDPTTPGYPSKPGVPRQPVESAIPSIPSIPISYVDAIPILKSLNGHGPGLKDFNKYWSANTGLQYKGVKYNVGPSPEDLVLNLVNEQEYVTTPLWNTIGIINGTLPDEVVVVGNHRDAWIAGGAADPNSGSAALNEAIRGFGIALSQGWKPLRTIVFASWDGEEYGLIGSTEWVEEYLPWLSAATVAYINMDVGCAGPNFQAAASPLLNQAIYEITSLVQSPNQTVKGQTVADTWNGHIATMGSGSDFTAFQDFAGIPSLDIGFTGGASDPVYQYHSNYDSYYWMATYGDPGFHYHATAAKILGLITAKLSETPIIPMNTTDYAIALNKYVGDVETKLSPSTASEFEFEADQARFRPEVVSIKGSASALAKSLKKLKKAVADIHENAVKFDANADALAKEVGSLPWWRVISKIKLYLAIKKSNLQVKYLERMFLFQEGLDGRPWFKHVIFAPGLWTGYAGGKSIFSSLHPVYPV